MALPAPNLDDRRFQELVDEAKRHVMRRCPEWTDHNVSDPGVTLIEAFAYMTDLLLYRLNRVPDRIYVKFLELIGLRLFPATAARTGVTFWLSAPAQAPLHIPVNTRVSSMRSERDDPLVFSTAEALDIIPCELETVATMGAEDEQQMDRTERMRLSVSFPAFGSPPSIGDSLYVGLTEAVPSNCVRLHFRCTIEGVGVDPDFPPLVWEAWDGAGWSACDVGIDQTGGLNRDGYIDVHVPRTHVIGVRHEQRAGWLRARVIEPVEDQPAYSSSPTVHGLVAGTVGGTADAVHADVVESEILGESEGVPGQLFKLQRVPVVGGAGTAEMDVSTEDGWQTWTEVAHFAQSGPDDHHYTFDPVFGEVRFGPVVRQPDGSLHQHGAIPPKGTFIQARSYATGGGQRGNAVKGALQVMRSSIPFVAAVENRAAASGGVDGEDIESAKVRGPILLRTRTRAVTAEDYEYFTREAAPEVARVRCVPAGAGPEAGTVRVLIVPAAPAEGGRIRFESLVPSAETLERIKSYLDGVRVVGTRILIEPPLYQGVTIVAQVRARARANANRIREEAAEALERYFNPLLGGPERTGWPWGRPVQAGEAFTVLQGIKGVEYVEEVRLFGANPVTGERGQATNRLLIEPSALVYSYGHQVRVQEA
jgi:predicted phage baseplate assembly protein